MDQNPRHPDHPVDRMFIDRWSPRAYTGEGIDEDTLMTILEAARWAPSAYNAQPWRFVYAHRDTDRWPALLGLLQEINQGWVKDAAAIVFVASDTLSRKPDGTSAASYTHSFDAGTAWGFMALQANRLGLYAHGMIGLDVERAQAELGIPTDFRVEAAIAIGHRGDPGKLPDQLRAREAPNERKPLSELAFEGRFGGA